VVDLGDAIALDSEAYDTCVIRGAERVVDCWGDNRPEHFGPAIGARSLYARPESVRGVAGIPVLDVSVSGLHTCVRTADQILCAGVNIGGALGRADDTIRTNVLGPPEGLPDGLTPVSIAASGPGGFGHTCVAMSDGLVYCFGANDYGQCGQPSETFSIYVPSPVPDLTGAVFVGAGYYASCALDTSGRVYCWGDNSYGQLGDGTEEGESSTPLRVDGLPAIGQLAVGSNFVLAVSREGDEVWGWGDGSSGQLGLGETMLIETGTPRRLLTSASATYEAFAGTNHACVIERPAAGRARLLCAGSNFYGELGGFDGPLSATFERVNALP
jgi:alpha-tubulin suppressor-like RCC1 family protein